MNSLHVPTMSLHHRPEKRYSTTRAWILHLSAYLFQPQWDHGALWWIIRSHAWRCLSANLSQMPCLKVLGILAFAKHSQSTLVSGRSELKIQEEQNYQFWETWHSQMKPEIKTVITSSNSIRSLTTKKSRKDCKKATKGPKNAKASPPYPSNKPIRNDPPKPPLKPPQEKSQT